MVARRRCGIALLGLLALVAGVLGVAAPRQFRVAGSQQELGEAVAQQRATSRSTKPVREVRRPADSVARGGGDDDVVEVAAIGERWLVRSCVVLEVEPPPGVVAARHVHRASARAPPPAA